jgi:hypothetical protein
VRETVYGVIEIGSGMAVRGEAYRERAEPLEAVGLSE